MKTKKLAKNNGAEHKGYYVWWDVKSLDIPKRQMEKDLAKHGLEDLVPRNDYKTAMRRALRFLLKNDKTDEGGKTDRFYRRSDEETCTKFYVVVPKWVYDAEGISDVSYERELIVRVDKDSGKVTFGAPADPAMLNLSVKELEISPRAKNFLGAALGKTATLRDLLTLNDIVFRSTRNLKSEVDAALAKLDLQRGAKAPLTWGDSTDHALAGKLLERYREAQKYIDADQFRKIILRTLREHCYGVGLRRQGGVYYVPESQEASLEKLRKIFATLEAHGCRLFETPVRDDESTNKAVEWAINDDITDGIQDIVEEVLKTEKDGKLTERNLMGSMRKADHILKTIRVHEKDLAGKCEALRAKAKLLETILVKKKDEPHKNTLADAFNSF